MKNDNTKYHHKYFIRNNPDYKLRIKLKKPKCTQKLLLNSKTKGPLFNPLQNFLFSKIL